MAGVVPKVAVIGSGISGAVCASTLAKNGFAVTVFDIGRGPGGRMSQRRETTEDGKDLFFDHGAPYFAVTNPTVLSIVLEWESRGLVREWTETFRAFDFISKNFTETDKEEAGRKYIGIPGMNSICRALCNEPGVETKFSTGVSKMDWVDENSWSLIGLNGQDLGNFDGAVATDKLLASRGFTHLTGHPPPLETVINMAPELASRLQDIPARSCFAVMLAFTDPLCSISGRSLLFVNSEVLSSAICDSSKPGRSSASECWVLHSTAEYAKKVIDQCDNGLKKPSNATLTKVADELLQEFQRTGLCTSTPYFIKAHRWGSAFPVTSIAREEKCILLSNKRLAVCGDFCVSPNVEGAIASGLAGASKLIELFSREGSRM